MQDFIGVAKIGEIPEGEGRAFTVKGRRVAVFLRQGEYHALDDTCPHMGASLAEGYLDETGVVCPWHAWKFCVLDGTWLDNPKSNIKSQPFSVRVENDEIQVSVPVPPARSDSGQQV